MNSDESDGSDASLDEEGDMSHVVGEGSDDGETEKGGSSESTSPKKKRKVGRVRATTTLELALPFVLCTCTCCTNQPVCGTHVLLHKLTSVLVSQTHEVLLHPRVLVAYL